MKHVIKDIPYSGSLIELDNKELLEEWKTWDRKYNENHTTDICEEGRPLFNKIREKYGINTLIQIGYLKDNHEKVGIIISDILVSDTIYHPSDSGWAKNNILATSLKRSEYEK